MTNRRSDSPADVNQGGARLILRNICTDIAKLDREREVLSAQRDRRIVDALRTGVPVPEIMETTGLSRARIYQLRDTARGATERTSA